MQTESYPTFVFIHYRKLSKMFFHALQQIIQARLGLGRARQGLGQARAWPGQARPEPGQARPWPDQAPTSLGQAWSGRGLV